VEVVNNASARLPVRVQHPASVPNKSLGRPRVEEHIHRMHRHRQIRHDPPPYGFHEKGIIVDVYA